MKLLRSNIFKMKTTVLCESLINKSIKSHQSSYDSLHNKRYAISCLCVVLLTEFRFPHYDNVVSTFYCTSGT